MEAIANQTQEQSEYESEDALEVFENYSSIRRKMQEKNVQRIPTGQQYGEAVEA